MNNCWISQLVKGKVRDKWTSQIIGGEHSGALEEQSLARPAAPRETTSKICKAEIPQTAILEMANSGVAVAKLVEMGEKSLGAFCLLGRILAQRKGDMMGEKKDHQEMGKIIIKY